MPHLELLDKRRTWVTPYQEVQMSRPTPNQKMHLKDEHGEKSCPEDLNIGSLPKGKIGIYPYLSFLHSFSFLFHHLH